MLNINFYISDIYQFIDQRKISKIIVNNSCYTSIINNKLNHIRYLLFTLLFKLVFVNGNENLFDIHEHSI